MLTTETNPSLTKAVSEEKKAQWISPAFEKIQITGLGKLGGAYDEVDHANNLTS